MIALVTLVAGLGGCLAVAAGAGLAAGAGTVVYVRGELQSTEELDLDTAWDATLAAVEELQFDIQERRKDAVAGRAVVHMADGREVRIRLEDEGYGLTTIKIRVGIWGDEMVSERILAKIRRHAGIESGQDIATDPR
jgi:hypothetical protein